MHHHNNNNNEMCVIRIYWNGSHDSKQEAGSCLKYENTRTCTNMQMSANHSKSNKNALLTANTALDYL